MNKKILDLAVPNIISIFFTLLYLIGGDAIFRLLTNNSEVISNAHHYFFWVIIVPLAFILFMLARSVTMGMMAKRAVFSRVE